MFTNWAAYALIELEGRVGFETELFCLKPSAKRYKLPGGLKANGDEHSVDTLLREILLQTGVTVRPDQVRRVKLPNKGKVGKKNFRLRFYRIIISADQFIFRNSRNEFELLTLSHVASLGERIEPPAKHILLVPGLIPSPVHA